MKFQDKFKPGDIICSDRGELKMSNIHGTCPHCNAKLDGDLIIDYPLSQGKSREEAILHHLESLGMYPPDTTIQACPNPMFQVFVEHIDIPHWIVLGWDNEEK